MGSSKDAASAVVGPAQLYSACICGEHKDAKVPTSGRTIASEIRYQCAKILGELRPLDEEAVLREWKYWKLIENRFPYDMIFSVHHMLIPKRMVDHREKLTISEDLELKRIVNEFDYAGAYDAVMDNFKGRRSILGLYHVHLVKWHKDRADFKI